MALKRKAYAGQPEAVGDRQVRVICSTADMDRAGEVVVQEGIDLSAYQANPVVLFQHDPGRPIARAIEIGLKGDHIEALVQFPPLGTSALADEVYGLTKAGVLNAVSIGLEPLEVEPIDEARPRGPVRYLKCALLELSFVSVPANAEALVVQRQQPPVRPAGAGPVVKSLYDVGCLARVMQEIGYIQSSAAWEAEVEEDGSKLPAMLGETLRQLGEALIAMTQEEVAEMLAAMPEPAATDSYVTAGKTVAVRKFRAGQRGIAPQSAPDIRLRRERASVVKVLALG